MTASPGAREANRIGRAWQRLVTWAGTRIYDAALFVVALGTFLVAALTRGIVDGYRAGRADLDALVKRLWETS